MFLWNLNTSRLSWNQKPLKNNHFHSEKYDETSKEQEWITFMKYEILSLKNKANNNVLCLSCFYKINLSGGLYNLPTLNFLKTSECRKFNFPRCTHTCDSQMCKNMLLRTGSRYKLVIINKMSSNEVSSFFEIPSWTWLS